ncbi:MAG: hypothetical protein ACR5LD_01280 [Symbiopectobacterium sp.]
MVLIAQIPDRIEKIVDIDISPVDYQLRRHNVTLNRDVHFLVRLPCSSTTYGKRTNGPYHVGSVRG